MNLKNPSTELLFVTVPVQVMSGSAPINGTGFIISIPVNDQKFIPVLVTNHHVVKNSSSVFIDLFKMDTVTNQPITSDKVRISFDTNTLGNFQSEELDIVFIPIAPMVEELATRKINLFFKSITPNMACSIEQEAKLAAMEEVIFIGYPYAIQERSRNLPVIRRGITATPVWSNFANNINHPETFLIDAGVFPGSSGSPVFIYNQGSYSDGANINIGTRLIFLGMIKSSLQNNNFQFIGLGEVIKSRVIFDFISRTLNITGF